MATTTTARRAARKAADSDSVQRLARLGLAGRGVLYVTVAALAIGVARGSRTEADRQGALRAIGDHLVGRLALGAVAAGFAGYALWRLAEATVRPGDKGAGGRLVSAAKGLLYTGFALTTASYVLTHHARSGSTRQRDLTARVLGWPGGRLLVGAAGLALLGAAGWNVWRAVSRRYRKPLKQREVPRRWQVAVDVVGTVGLLGRGLAFGLVAAFLVASAVTYDPEKSQGLDGALRRTAHAPYGRPVIWVVALGLATFGVWSFVEARYRKVLGS